MNNLWGRETIIDRAFPHVLRIVMYFALAFAISMGIVGGSLTAIKLFAGKRVSNIEVTK